MKFVFIFFLLLISCTMRYDDSYICDTKDFDLKIIGLNDINNKELSNNIINNSGLLYNSNSTKTLNLNVTITRQASLLSGSNITNIENVNLETNYEVINKKNSKVVYGGFIRIIDTLSVSKTRRFANYREEQFVYKNLIYDLSRELKSRMDLFLNKCFVK